MKKTRHGFTRREFVGANLAFLAGAAWADQAPPEGPYILGYTDRTSYRPGETIRFHLSSSATKVRAEIVRIGKEKETVWRSGDISGIEHPIPENASSRGCGWPVGFEMKIPDNWRTGFYETKLTSAGGDEVTGKTIPFIVRAAAPGTASKILLQLSTNTSNAYNNWGGYSFYAYNGRDNAQGRRVSFERPQLESFHRNWDIPFIVWAEENGYELEYASNNDLEFHPEMLDAYNLILSVGHDEYWSSPMRDHTERFIRRGGNVAFFSGNTCCWQVRNEEAGRAMTCWKQAWKEDPFYNPEGPNPLLSSLWSHHLIDRPETQLTGVGFLYGGFHKSHDQFMDGSGALTVHRPESWVFEGTGLAEDEEFGGKDTIAGYECDGCEHEWVDGKPVPTHKDGTPESFRILATAPARWHPADCEWYERWEKGRTGAATMGYYTVPDGGTVFTAATTDWSHGLKGKDPHVERITRNVMDRLTKRTD